MTLPPSSHFHLHTSPQSPSALPTSPTTAHAKTPTASAFFLPDTSPTAAGTVPTPLIGILLPAVYLHRTATVLPSRGRRAVAVFEGLYLLEIDRILRPGGYWVLSGPPINWKQMYKGWERTPEDLEAEQNDIEDLAQRLCWKKVAEKGPIAVWRKPTNHLHCATKLKTLNSLHFSEGRDPDTAWYDEMQACLTPLPKAEQIRDTAGGMLAKWPKRLIVVPPRIKSSSVKGVTSENFNHDNRIWNQRVSNYGIYINFSLAGRYRNIMDMNAGLGGFAAALEKYQVWVMNVIPVNTSINTLGIIYERGLLGTYMNWCEAFSTYPRTYDLIHANGIFSMYIYKCELIDILLEMDRILRPGGTVIIRDHVDIIVKLKNEAERLGWQCRMVHSEKGPFHQEKLLIVDNSIKSYITRN